MKQNQYVYVMGDGETYEGVGPDSFFCVASDEDYERLGNDEHGVEVFADRDDRVFALELLRRRYATFMIDDRSSQRVYLCDSIEDARLAAAHEIVNRLSELYEKSDQEEVLELISQGDLETAIETWNGVQGETRHENGTYLHCDEALRMRPNSLDDVKALAQRALKKLANPRDSE